MSSIAKVLVGISFLLFVMALAYSVATNSASDDYKRLAHDSEVLHGGNDELRTRNTQMREHVAALRVDSRVIERRIRDDLGMVRRDEVVILLNQPEPNLR